MAYDTFFQGIQASVPPNPQTFTRVEVTKVVKSFRNKTSSGLDGLSNSSIKIVNQCHSNILPSLFNTCLSPSSFHWASVKRLTMPESLSSYTGSLHSTLFHMSPHSMYFPKQKLLQPRYVSLCITTKLISKHIYLSIHLFLCITWWRIDL